MTPDNSTTDYDSNQEPPDNKVFLVEAKIITGRDSWTHPKFKGENVSAVALENGILVITDGENKYVYNKFEWSNFSVKAVYE